MKPFLDLTHYGGTLGYIFNIGLDRWYFFIEIFGYELMFGLEDDE